MFFPHIIWLLPRNRGNCLVLYHFFLTSHLLSAKLAHMFMKFYLVNSSQMLFKMANSSTEEYGMIVECKRWSVFLKGQRLSLMYAWLSVGSANWIFFLGSTDFSTLSTIAYLQVIFGIDVCTIFDQDPHSFDVSFNSCRMQRRTLKKSFHNFLCIDTSRNIFSKPFLNYNCSAVFFFSNWHNLT